MSSIVLSHSLQYSGPQLKYPNCIHPPISHHHPSVSAHVPGGESPVAVRGREYFSPVTFSSSPARCPPDQLG